MKAPHFRGRGRLRARRAMFALTTILGSGFATPLFAQTVPIRQSIDANGVDLFLGTMNVDGPTLSAGQGGPHQLVWRKYTRNNIWSDTVMASLTVSGSSVYVTLGETADRFTISGSSYIPTEGNGASLTLSGSVYTYTASDGTVVHYNKTYVGTYPYGSVTGLVTDITHPSGAKLTYSYDDLYICVRDGLARAAQSGEPDAKESEEPDEEGESGEAKGESEVARSLDGCKQHGYIYRIASVTNRAGYTLTFNYDSYLPPDPDYVPNNSFFQTWGTVLGVSIVNSARSSAAAGSQSFNFSTSGGNTYLNITDAMSQTTKYRVGGSLVLGITRPGSGSEDVTIAYSGVKVSSVTDATGTTSYSYSDASGVRTTTVTDPLGHATVYKFDISSERLTQVTNALSKSTTYTYDGSGRVTRVTAHEGNYTQYTYDARGNVTETRSVSKTSGTPADIVTTASYPSSCLYAATCNKPEWTQDAKGNQTDYSYDNTTGNLLSVTAPAPSSGAPRPQTRYSYTTISSVDLVSAISTCRTTSSCIGGADETKVTIGYDSNLLPNSVTTAAGDASLSATTAATYDVVGNRISVDGPLSGTADTVTYRYDAGRQLVGVVSPDPDGGGSRQRVARRLTYDSKGRVTLAETGTVTDVTDPAWAAFSAAQAVAASYDGAGRKLTEAVQAGGTTYQLTQYSYDAHRLDCVAVRMNTAIFGSLPSSACTLGTTGSAGPDRIVKYAYDNADRAIKVTSGYGTAEAADDVTTTYSNNGRVATVADAKGNLTTYEYDGHDRLVKTRYPLPSTPGSSSTTDYEQFTLDANGNVTSRRLRDTTSIGFTYDALDRVTLKDLPGSEPDVTYTYDLQGRPTGASQTGNALTFGYDALGRNTSQAGPQGTAASQYDVAGRRTRLTWPGGGFYVDYDYDVTGRVTAIRENGATSGPGVLATYSYDDLGRRTNVTRGNGSITQYGYVGPSWLGSIGSSFTSAWDTMVITLNGRDPAGGITMRSISRDSFAWSGAVNADRAYTVNGLNQYGSAGGTSFGYDARGNLTSSGSNSYTYSSENLLRTGPSSTTLDYDPLLRLYQISQTGTTRFAYDGDAMIAEYNASNVLQRRHVFGAGTDEVVATIEAGGTRSWPIPDERGSIVTTTDGSGNIGAVAGYDEYGIPAGGNVGRFGYTGQAWLSELGMHYYKARMYSPTLGRFLQTDPIGYGGGMNWYNYVGSDPINKIDPSGLDWVKTYCRTVSVAVEYFNEKGEWEESSSNPTEKCDLEWMDEPAQGNPGGEGAGTLAPPSSRCISWRGVPACASTASPKNSFHIEKGTPPNSKGCTAGGLSFRAPNDFNPSAIVQSGAAGGLLGANAAVGHFGAYDFQRDRTQSGTTFYQQYTSVSNMAVGFYLVGAGYSRASANLISDAFASVFSSNGASSEQDRFRNLAYDVAAGKAKIICYPQ